MKAVIVEIRGDTAAALGRDGSVFKVKNRAYAIGQTIHVRRVVLSRQLAVLAACAAAVFLIIGAGIHTYVSPYSIVSLDVNPSLQYTLNRLNVVLSVEAVNGDGTELLEEVGRLNNRSIEDAITITVRQIAQDGYFDGDDPGGMVIAASCRDHQEAERIAENVRETALRATQESAKEVVVAAMTVGEDQIEQARQLGVSPGKLTLVEQLRDTASDPDSIDVQEWLEKPVKDIMKETASQTPQSQDPASSGETGSAPASGEGDGSQSGGASSGETLLSGQDSGESKWQDSGKVDPGWASSAEELVSSGGTPMEYRPTPPRPSRKDPASTAQGGGTASGSGAGDDTQTPAASAEDGGEEIPAPSGDSGTGGTTASGSHESGKESAGGGDTAAGGTTSGGTSGAAGGTSGSASSSPSHEAPVESGGSSSGTKPEQTASSEASSSKRSSSKSYGYPMPPAPDPNVSLPWWEQMD